MSLKSEAISGVKWTTLATFTLAMCALIKVSVLARLLDKSDFGLMALVTFVMGFMDLFMDMGLTSAILHKQEIKSSEYSSLYWLNVFFSILLFLLMVTIGPLVAEFYNQPELQILISIMGLGILLSAIGRQFKTILQKNLDFRTIALIEITSSLISLGLAIYLAVHNYGVYALVYSALSHYFISNVGFFFIGRTSHYLRWHFKYRETRPFLRIGIYQVGGQVVNYFNRDLDVLLIGKFFGPELLGGYSLAKQLVFRPVQVLNPIFTRVASPILAKLQYDKPALKENYLKLVNVIVSINAPIFLAIIIFAPYIVQILYGSDYENIIDLVRILSVYMVFRSISNPIGSLVIATGRTDLEFYWNLITLGVLPIAIIIGTQFSLEWVAMLMALTILLLLVPSWYFLIRKMTGTSLSEYIKTIVILKVPKL